MEQQLLQRQRFVGTVEATTFCMNKRHNKMSRQFKPNETSYLQHKVKVEVVEEDAEAMAVVVMVVVDEAAEEVVEGEIEPHPNGEALTQVRTITMWLMVNPTSITWNQSVGTWIQLQEPMWCHQMNKTTSYQ
jgi:hypothetical protein